MTLKQASKLIPQYYTSFQGSFQVDVTPLLAPCRCWGGVCRVRRWKGAGVMELGGGAVSGCRWAESRDSGKKTRRCRPEGTAEPRLSTAQTWPPSCSFCSCWTPSCCASECRPSSWWGAGSPGRRQKTESSLSEFGFWNCFQSSGCATVCRFFVCFCFCVTDSRCVVWSRARRRYTPAPRWRCVSTELSCSCDSWHKVFQPACWQSVREEKPSGVWDTNTHMVKTIGASQVPYFCTSVQNAACRIERGTMDALNKRWYDQTQLLYAVYILLPLAFILLCFICYILLLICFLN